MNTAQTIKLIRAVAALELRPFTKDDFYAYADADADSQIAEADLAEVVCDITGKPVLTEGGALCTVIVSGTTVEIYAIDPNYDTICISMSINPEAI